MKGTGAILRAAAFLLLLAPLSGCLLTLGGPLARRVEPGRWRLEAAAGPAIFNPYGVLDGCLYGYAGRALGRHWEVGLIPYLYSIYGNPVFVLAAPLRWDPFPYSWAVHLIPFAGPAVALFPEWQIVYGGFTGMGLSLRIGDLAELYAAASAFLPAATFATAAAGVRFDLRNGFELGIGALFHNPVEEYPGLAVATVTLSTLLGR